VLEVDDA
jgi:hypothetical protein